MSHKLDHQLLKLLLIFFFFFSATKEKKVTHPLAYSWYFQILPGSADAQVKRMLSRYQACCAGKGKTITWLNHLHVILQVALW